MGSDGPIFSRSLRSFLLRNAISGLILAMYTWPLFAPRPSHRPYWLGHLGAALGRFSPPWPWWVPGGGIHQVGWSGEDAVEDEGAAREEGLSDEDAGSSGAARRVRGTSPGTGQDKCQPLMRDWLWRSCGSRRKALAGRARRIRWERR
jgi:hypothetical protein